MPRELMIVTPELAANWQRGSMQFNDRDSFRVNVRKLVDRIRAGTWAPQLKHQPIIVERGTLRDGNHRVAAIISFGGPVLMCVESDGTLDDPHAKARRTGRWRPYATKEEPQRENRP